MKGDMQIIVCLNKVLRNELTMMHQFFLRSSMVKNGTRNKIQDCANHARSPM